MPHSLPSTPQSFTPPPPRPVEIDRRELDDLLDGFGGRIILLTAPSGYGKSTTAARWCARQSRTALWIALSRDDGDPVHFCRTILSALDVAAPLDADEVSVLVGPPDRVKPILLPTITKALLKREPLVVVLDDEHLSSSPASDKVLAHLVRTIGTNSRLVISSRVVPRIPISKLRAGGDLLEVGINRLRMDSETTARMIARRRLSWSPDAIEQLRLRTEGWPAGIGLAVMRAASDGDEDLDGLTGRRYDLAEYFLDEVLAGQSEAVRTFLLATAALGPFTAQLCDDVLRRHDSADTIDELTSSNLFVIPLDAERRWFRYHHLFGEYLADRFERADPSKARKLLQRAAHWHREHGMPSQAVELGQGSGDHALVGSVMLRDLESTVGRGELETYRRWLDRVDDADICSDPAYAIAAATTFLRLGDLDRAARYAWAASTGDLDVPSPDGAVSLRTRYLVIRNSIGQNSVSQMLIDAEDIDALERPARTRWLSVACRLRGTAHLLGGDASAAVPAFEEMRSLAAEQPNTAYIRVTATTYLVIAMHAVGRTDDAVAIWAADREFIESVRGYWSAETTASWLAEAIVHRRRNHLVSARGALTSFEDGLASIASHRVASCDLAVRAAVEAIALGDREMARRFVDFAATNSGGLVDGDTFHERVERLRADLDGVDVLAPLSPAELRVLRELASHRTMEEIGRKLYVSRSTVKTHAASIYSKLGVSSRGEAVAVLESAQRHGRPD